MSKGRRSGRLSESAGRNMSERRASLENVCCGSRPSTREGKAAAGDASNNRASQFHRGNGDGTRQEEQIAITRDPLYRIGVLADPTDNPRGPGRDRVEDGKVRSTDDAE